MTRRGGARRRARPRLCVETGAASRNRITGLPRNRSGALARPRARSGNVAGPDSSERSMGAGSQRCGVVTVRSSSVRSCRLDGGDLKRHRRARRLPIFKSSTSCGAGRHQTRPSPEIAKTSSRDDAAQTPASRCRKERKAMFLLRRHAHKPDFESRACNAHRPDEQVLRGAHRGRSCRGDGYGLEGVAAVTFAVKLRPCRFCSAR